MDYGKAVRVARRHAGVSQGVLARESGYTQCYLSLLERGKRQPSLTALSAISGALNIGLLVLLSYGAAPEDVAGSIMDKSSFKITVAGLLAPHEASGLREHRA